MAARNQLEEMRRQLGPGGGGPGVPGGPGPMGAPGLSNVDPDSRPGTYL